MSDFKPTLASPDASPPTPSSYWVVPDLLLAGAYPGHPQAEKHRARVESLVNAGIRVFVSLMEPHEVNNDGNPFTPYAGLAQQLCPEIVCIRYPIRDCQVPTGAEMLRILDELDGRLKTRKPVYVHCWGGVGRTGTVVGCWLLRHKLATPSDVLDVLRQLRQQDEERGHRTAPETPEQRVFVQRWQDTNGTDL